jgi:site-specific DNA-cytosine methylase
LRGEHDTLNSDTVTSPHGMEQMFALPCVQLPAESVSDAAPIICGSQSTLTERQEIAAGYLPEEPTLDAIATWYVAKLPHSQQCTLRGAVALSKSQGRPLRVGTMCSGTDAPIPVLGRLCAELNIEIEHVFSTEINSNKRAWILGNHPNLQHLYGDNSDVASGKAFNFVSDLVEQVPGVDWIVSGFSGNDVSSENIHRAACTNFGSCIAEGSGRTGRTFATTLEAAVRLGCTLLILDNVTGLLKKIQGAPPLIIEVMSQLRVAGFSAGYHKVNTKQYLLPQRRHRVYIWAIRGHEHQCVSRSVGTALVSLESAHRFSLRRILGISDSKGIVSSDLLPRQAEVVAAVFQKHPGLTGLDVVLDVSKSKDRCPWSRDCVPCVLPGGLLWRVLTHCFLTPLQMLAVQGIWACDFPILLRDGADKPKPTLLRDLAGNAFSTTVFMAFALAILTSCPTVLCQQAHAKLQDPARSPSSGEARQPST